MPAGARLKGATLKLEVYERQYFTYKINKHPEKPYPIQVDAFVLARTTDLNKVDISSHLHSKVDKTSHLC